MRLGGWHRYVGWLKVFTFTLKHINVCQQEGKWSWCAYGLGKHSGSSHTLRHVSPLLMEDIDIFLKWSQERLIRHRCHSGWTQLAAGKYVLMAVISLQTICIKRA